MTPPVITSEQIDARLALRLPSWRARLPRVGPRSFRWPADSGALPSSAALVERLRRVCDAIVDDHWLRVNTHQAAVLAAARERFDPRVPTYIPWRELSIAGQIADDARQELWQRDVGDNLPALALAAILFGDAKYRAAIRAHVFAALEYPSWGDGEGVRDRDLSCGHLARGIAIAVDWLPDLWSADELARIRATLTRKVDELLTGLLGGAYWHDGWRDNHNHVALAGLGIAGLIFLDRVPDAGRWLAAAELGLEHVARLANADGSSAEGLPYWSYGTSFLLQLIEATRDVTGSDRAYDADYFRNAFHYRLQSSTPALGATLPWGDAVAHDYYGPSHLLRALARQYRDPHAQWLADHVPFEQTGGADCEAWDVLWNDATLVATPPTLELDTHFAEWDAAVSRSGWRPDDVLVTLKGGFTNRNHSHLDAGAIAIAWGDEWLLTAPGYGKVGPGFWDVRGPRWTYFSNATESHATLLVNGRNQRFDAAARGTIIAVESTPASTRIAIDLTGAYDGVRRVRREVTHRRGTSVRIVDEVELAEDGVVEWLLQPGGEVERRADGVVIARGRSGAIEARMIEPALPFEPRAPTSPHVDVARVTTHAVAARGRSVRFECLLTLVRAG